MDRVEDTVEAWVAELGRRSASMSDDTLLDADAVHARVRAALHARRAPGR